MFTEKQLFKIYGKIFLKMENYHIEKLALYHLDDIMEIEERCYGQHHWSRNSFAGELENSCARYIVAVNENNKAVGYMGVWRIFDEAHVTNLAVHPDFQGKGIAHLLVISSLDMCNEDKIKFMTLEVRKSNEKAKNLYENFGFKSLGMRKKYYQDNNEDAIIMWTENIFSDKYRQILEERKQYLNSRITNEQKISG